MVNLVRPDVVRLSGFCSQIDNDNQLDGGIFIQNGDFSFSFENDFFSRFVGAGKQDRWRTGGAEITYGKFVLGAQVYTNDPQNMPITEEDKRDKTARESLTWKANDHNKGSWRFGDVLASPFYAGYKSGNSVTRIGINAPIVQDIFQNGIHKNGIFGQGYQNYYLNYKFQTGPYFYTGYNNPFSIYTY